MIFCPAATTSCPTCGFKPPKGKEAAAAPRNVINLMDALKASIKAEKKPSAAAAKRSAPAKKRA
jgi:non-homologous end joining protein Ku